MHIRCGAVLALLLALGCQRTPPPPPEAVAPQPVVDARSQRGGPVPDYDRVSGVTLHAEIEEMAPELRATLSRFLGGRLLVAGYTAPDPDEPDQTAPDLSLVWLRDYQPIYVRDAQGRLTTVHYLAENPNRSLFRPPAPGPQRAHRTWMPSPDGGRWLRSRVMPLLHENGNLLVAGPWVFVSDKIVEDNGIEHDEPHLIRQGYRPRSPDEVIEVLAKSLDRRPENIVVLPQMPHEATGHVDLFLLPLDDETVMIPRIEDRSLALIEGPDEEVAREVKRFLDEQAVFVRSLGLTVHRWPMLPPVLSVVTDDEDRGDRERRRRLVRARRGGVEEYELLVFSPANALLVDVVAGHHGEPPVKLGLLPGFTRAFEDPAMVGLSATYARRWERELARRGFTSVTVDASELVSYLGLFHCVTAPIPTG